MCRGRAGSSPRARGAGTAQRPAGQTLRFIPACAGSRPSTQHSPPEITVHPRVRGEQASTIFGVLTPRGSSPRARGAVGAERIEHDGQRFIPACAGSSGEPLPGSVPCTVHPRVRGEQWLMVEVRVMSIGSSPRARGAGETGSYRRCIGRFIPACAGSRQERPGPEPPPRGSSPRARGAVDRRIRVVFRNRFIPACAGSRDRDWPLCRCSPVHPRVRGEQ